MILNITIAFVVFLLSVIPRYTKMVIKTTITKAGIFKITFQLPIIGALVMASYPIRASLLKVSLVPPAAKCCTASSYPCWAVSKLVDNQPGK